MQLLEASIKWEQRLSSRERYDSPRTASYLFLAQKLFERCSKYVYEIVRKTLLIFAIGFWDLNCLSQLSCKFFSMKSWWSPRISFFANLSVVSPCSKDMHLWRLLPLDLVSSKFSVIFLSRMFTMWAFFKGNSPSVFSWFSRSIWTLLSNGANWMFEESFSMLNSSFICCLLISMC